MCGLGRNVGRFGGEVRFGYDRDGTRCDKTWRRILMLYISVHFESMFRISEIRW